ncbi:MAG TPA: hypothetical protein VML55_00335 [Planctomycetaceae bacterium]|nr:hypothetical protein [Planctomycetaceae bacterium]
MADNGKPGTSIIAALTGRLRKGLADARDAYWRIVNRAAGEDPNLNADAALQTLQAAGKSPEQFQQDVELILKRREAVAAIAEYQKLREGLDEADARRTALLVKRREAIKKAAAKFDAELREIAELETRVAAEGVRAGQLQKFLRENAPPELAAEAVRCRDAARAAELDMRRHVEQRDLVVEQLGEVRGARSRCADKRQLAEIDATLERGQKLIDEHTAAIAECNQRRNELRAEEEQVIGLMYCASE